MEQLQTSQDILSFAEKRGAKVEVLNSAGKVIGHNLVTIPRMQCFHKKAWNPRDGDWKTFVGLLYDMGLRLCHEDSARPEWCKWCKFQLPEDTQSCTSTQFTCRRLERKSWQRKL